MLGKYIVYVDEGNQQARENDIKMTSFSLRSFNGFSIGRHGAVRKILSLYARLTPKGDTYFCNMLFIVNIRDEALKFWMVHKIFHTFNKVKLKNI